MYSNDSAMYSIDSNSAIAATTASAMYSSDSVSANTFDIFRRHLQRLLREEEDGHPTCSSYVGPGRDVPHSG